MRESKKDRERSWQVRAREKERERDVMTGERERDKSKTVKGRRKSVIKDKIHGFL